jgi:hypothetical protein
MPDPKRILIDRPNEITILAARHLDQTEGPVQTGRLLTTDDRAAINTVLRYVSRAHNAPAADAPVTPADAPADAAPANLRQTITAALYGHDMVPGMNYCTCGTWMTPEGLNQHRATQVLGALAPELDRQRRVAAEPLRAVEAERDTAYSERAALVAWLAALYPAVRTSAPDVDAPGWQLVFLDVDGRQASWHIAPPDYGQFLHIPRVEPGDPRAAWDGHTTPEKYQRIRDHIAELHDAGTYAVVDELRRTRIELEHWQTVITQELRDEVKGLRDRRGDAELAVEEARGAAARLAQALHELLDAAQRFGVIGLADVIPQEDYDRWRTVLETAAPRVNDPSPQASHGTDAKPLTPADTCPAACTEAHTYDGGCLRDPHQLPDDTGAISQGSGPARDSWAWRCWGTDTCDGWLSFDHGSAAAARRAYDRHVRHKHGKPVPPGVGRTTLCCSRFRSQEKHAAHNWRGFAGSEAVYCPGWGWNLPDSMPPLPRRRALRPGLIRDLIDGARRARTDSAAAHHVAAAGLEAFPHDQQDGEQP